MRKLLDVNRKRLWELARTGKSAREIMHILNIEDVSALRHTLHDVMLESGEPLQVPGLT